MSQTQHIVELVHQLVGYPTVFLLAPIALLTFGGASGHRSAGLLFVALMVFLYGTGLYMSLTRHEFGTWAYFRNLGFNFFGFYLMLVGLRAMYLYRHPRLPCPVTLDYFLAWVLTMTAAWLFALALVRNTPVRVFAILAIVLTVLEWKEIRRGFTPRGVLYSRHARYILGSFFYVLTVASIVHLGDELSRNAKWLWPTALGVVLVPVLTTRRPALRRFSRRVAKPVSIFLVVMTVSFGAYAIYEISTGRAPIGGQRM